ncbi:MAG: nucleotidyltransferase family protein [Candidatus Heimdallarchaeota archaeon]|nr:MAG: nucleotidyltransferase family protein [Candidatus Heimdallarchaeota archaeon]
MNDKEEILGVLWIGGQSSRFTGPSEPAPIKMDSNKIFALLHEKPLFTWAFENLRKVVDRCVFSFNSSIQYNRFKSFIHQASIILPEFDAIVDSPIVPTRGPLQAQLTVLRKFTHASRIVTVSADMPFIPPSLIETLLLEPTSITTLQSSNNVIEPLVSVFFVKKCKPARNFLLFFPFGRADDFHRCVDTLTLVTVSSDYPSKMTPWNQNINFSEDIAKLNQKLSPFTTGYKPNNRNFIKKKRTIECNNPKTQLVISELNLTQEGEKSEIEKNRDFDDLIQLKGFFYAGRYAEFIALNSEHMKAKQWFSKASSSYWNETQFWMKEKVPFLAIHSLKDCHQCMKRSGLNYTWKLEANDLLVELEQQLNLSKSTRESHG